MVLVPTPDWVQKRYANCGTGGQASAASSRSESNEFDVTLTTQSIIRRWTDCRHSYADDESARCELPIKVMLWHPAQIDDPRLDGHIARAIGPGDERDVILSAQFDEQRLFGRVPSKIIGVEDMYIFGEDVGAMKTLVGRIDESLAVFFDRVACVAMTSCRSMKQIDDPSHAAFEHTEIKVSWRPALARVFGIIFR